MVDNEENEFRGTHIDFQDDSHEEEKERDVGLWHLRMLHMELFVSGIIYGIAGRKTAELGTKKGRRT